MTKTNTFEQLLKELNTCGDNIYSIMYEVGEVLNKASYDYYKDGTSIMDNYMYDALSDALEMVERKLNYICENSPTNKIGFENKDTLDNVMHEEPSLSLSKTKSREELVAWLKGLDGCLSWKLDGLTIVLTYENGKLKQAVTRGNGIIGQDITHNAIRFKGIPRTINYKGKMIVRGESLISKKEFERINNNLPEEISAYKNPRNLVSGTVQQHDSRKTFEREVCFKAFTLVKMEDKMPQKYSDRLNYLKELGFDIVEYVVVNEQNLNEKMDEYFDNIEKYKFETDGLVLFYEDAEYGESLGNTSKFPRGGIAFKWKDETSITKIKDVRWTEGRTGILTPTAIFETVEIDGTSVSKASCHNVSILENLQLGIGDEVSVYKANMIIPQIAENFTRSGTLSMPPSVCPFCGEKTSIEGISDIKILYCKNSKCAPKNVEKFTHFCSVNALNIKGFAERTIETFMEEKFVSNFVDLLLIDRYKDRIISMDGFGKKSYENLIKSIEKAKNTTLDRLLVAIGINEIGPSNAKVLAKYVKNDANKIPVLTIEELSSIEGIGDIIARNIVSWFENEENLSIYTKLVDILNIEKYIEEENSSMPFDGKVFVITGDLNVFSNRKEATLWIEKHGGKVSSSVSNKTFALINNDKLSTSSKNKKAKELNILIIGEEDLLQMV